MLRYCWGLIVVVAAAFTSWIAPRAAVLVVRMGIIVITERVVQVRVARIAVLRTVAYTLVAFFMVFIMAIVMSIITMFTIMPVVITVANWRWRRRLRSAAAGIFF